MSDLKKRFSGSNMEEMELPKGHRERFLSKLDKDRSKGRSHLWKVAAGLAIVIASSAIYWSAKNSVLQTAEVKEQEEEQLESEYAIPIEDAAVYYKQTLEAQFAKLNEFYKDEDSKQLIEETKLLIAELQKEYEKLEKDLERTGDERIVIAMIGNYQKRIELLEELVLKLNYIKQLKLEQNEKANQNA